MQIDFKGKLAVVSGGANGIGLAIARQLAASGAETWILDLERERPADVAAGFNAHGMVADCSDRSQIERAFASLPAVPDVVMVNAGLVIESDFLSLDIEAWNRTIALNLTGAFHTVQTAARLMKARRSGSIVLTASTNSFDGEQRLIAYNASKSGLLGLLHTAANELGPHGIRVNAVCPGLIHTRLTQASFDNPAILREYFRHIALGRGGKPEEVANAAVFLASDLASFITGVTLFVDGGQMASKFGTWTEQTAKFEDGKWILS
ncbi:MAG TPA: SDR family NAD(P)-dependent oxidoreductase [Bryobacteraceae bacterium]|nr:SDR family NAD(P)-dependent oxidoreductase [Bryobacteraceae bacterium]